MGAVRDAGFEVSAESRPEVKMTESQGSKNNDETFPQGPGVRTVEGKVPPPSIYKPLGHYHERDGDS